jgi:hypothetical protein
VAFYIAISDFPNAFPSLTFFSISLSRKKQSHATTLVHYHGLIREKNHRTSLLCERKLGRPGNKETHCPRKSRDLDSDMALPLSSLEPLGRFVNF